MPLALWHAWMFEMFSVCRLESWKPNRNSRFQSSALVDVHLSLRNESIKYNIDMKIDRFKQFKTIKQHKVFYIGLSSFAWRCAFHSFASSFAHYGKCSKEKFNYYVCRFEFCSSRSESQGEETHIYTEHQNLYLWDAYEKYIAPTIIGDFRLLFFAATLTLCPHTTCNESECVQELVFSCRCRCHLDGISLYFSVSLFAQCWYLCRADTCVEKLFVRKLLCVCRSNVDCFSIIFGLIFFIHFSYK